MILPRGRCFAPVAVVLLIGASCASSPATVGTRVKPRTADPWASLDPGWNKLAPPPIRRYGQVVQWTGSQLINWGGFTPSGDIPTIEGQAYDPATNTWHDLPASPIGTRYNASSVSTGSSVLIWGGFEPGYHMRVDGAAFDASSNTWSPIPEAPLSARDPAATVWTGSEMIVWGSRSRRKAHHLDGAAYDPSSKTWRLIAPAPLKLNEADSVWSGSEMIVYGSYLNRRNVPDTRYARGEAYDPSSDSWRVIRRFRHLRQTAAAAWTGSEMIAYDSIRLASGAYDPATDSWKKLPKLPLSVRKCHPYAGNAGSVVVAWYCGQAAILPLPPSTWSRAFLPSGFDSLISSGRVSGGSAYAVIIDSNGTHPNRKAVTGLWAYKP